MTTSIVAEKIDQAIGILNELEIDAWLTFVRESVEAGDPVLPLILGQNLTWQSALLITRSGQRIAIVGKYEDDAVRATGVWPEVIPYVQSIRRPLVETLRRLGPRSLAVNYSVDDVKADGLSHGLYLVLADYLAETPSADRLTSAAKIIHALRGRKTATELASIRAAITTTQEIFAAVEKFARPGRTEAEIAQFMQAQAAQHCTETAWDAQQCPIVSTGPDSMIGHALPSAKLTIQPGRIFHLDFGVRRDEYCADLQRAWYVPADGEHRPPESVQRAFDTIVRAIQAAARTIEPGVEGWHVDQAARRVIIDAGYPEYQHATGHHVGRSAHDGAGVLGPKWERYGRTPHYALEPGNVLTLELGIDNVDDRGYLGLEEMILVTADGSEWLSKPQTTLPLLSRQPEEV